MPNASSRSGPSSRRRPKKRPSWSWSPPSAASPTSSWPWPTARQTVRDPLTDTIDAILERHLRVLSEIAPDDDATRKEIVETVDELRRLVTGIGYIGDCPPAVRDRIIATGERLSAPMVAAALRAMGRSALPVCGTEVIRTDSNHGSAEVDLEATTDLARRRLLAACETAVPVVTGFIGADRHGDADHPRSRRLRPHGDGARRRPRGGNGSRSGPMSTGSSPRRPGSSRAPGRSPS